MNMKNLENHIEELLHRNHSVTDWDIPLDYFSWGRDLRHKVDNTETLPGVPFSKSILSKIRYTASAAKSLVMGASSRNILKRFKINFSQFEKTYQLMSDESSRGLFAELIYMKLVGEKNMRLSSFTEDFISSYEEASNDLLACADIMQIYSWKLRKINIDIPELYFYTTPTILNLHYSGKLYRYQNKSVTVEVNGGDIVIDAGVGWGDTTIYLAALTNQKTGGHVYAFDILEEGINALSKQLELNPSINNITTVLNALSDKDGDQVYITEPGPGARVVRKKTKRFVNTVTIDSFVNHHKITKVDFIKMDIEGAEAPALVGAEKTINNFKPKLAISAYHKWDDLLVIPELINSVRDDYSFYLDCTTGFGGETVLYCC